MIILALRTDKLVAEISILRDEEILISEKWEAHLKLAESIHLKIKQILNKTSITLDEVQGIAIYKGPGSFTGLRIGVSVANSLAFSLCVPVVGSTSENWAQKSMKKLKDGKSDKVVLPEYGAGVRTTIQKK